MNDMSQQFYQRTCLVEIQIRLYFIQGITPYVH